MSKIGILCIATGKYKSFVQQLVDGIEKNFLTEHEREVYLFTDEIWEYKSGLNIVQTIIPPYKWPEASMLRFKTYTARDYDCEFLFHTDIDMGFVGKVGNEFLNEITVVTHPGFYNNKQSKGSWEERKESNCYVPVERRNVYVCGGVNGGVKAHFYHAMQLMKMWIENDLSNNIIPRYHDESAINKLVTLKYDVTYLSPSYCMPEAMTKRVKWGLKDFEPKILALEKNFAEIRK